MSIIFEKNNNKKVALSGLAHGDCFVPSYSKCSKDYMKLECRDSCEVLRDHLNNSNEYLICDLEKGALALCRKDILVTPIKIEVTIKELV